MISYIMLHIEFNTFDELRNTYGGDYCNLEDQLAEGRQIEDNDLGNDVILFLQESETGMVVPVRIARRETGYALRQLVAVHGIRDCKGKTSYQALDLILRKGFISKRRVRSNAYLMDYDGTGESYDFGWANTESDMMFKGDSYGIVIYKYSSTDTFPRSCNLSILGREQVLINLAKPEDITVCIKVNSLLDSAEEKKRIR